MSNLIDAENEESWAFHLPKVEKELLIAKKNLTTAFDKYLKDKLAETEKTDLLGLKNKVEQASYSSDL